MTPRQALITVHLDKLYNEMSGQETVEEVLAILNDPQWVKRTLKRIEREMRTGRKG